VSESNQRGEDVRQNRRAYLDSAAFMENERMSGIVLGIVGAGRIIRQGYMAILPLVNCVEEVLLYDLDRSNADAVIEEYDSWLLQDKFAAAHAHHFADAQLRATKLRPRLRVVTSVHDVFRHSDAVLITTPPSSHLEIAQACLDAGGIALIEKPLTVSSTAAREFARRNESVLHRVKYLENYAHNPAFERVKRMLEDDAFGRPLLISVFLGKSLPVDGNDNWRLNACCSGGGVLSDWGSHTFGLALYLAGEGYRVTSVKPEAVHFIPDSRPPVESYALTSVFGETVSRHPLTLLVENSWECQTEQFSWSGFRVSIALTRGTIQVHQKVADGRKDYLISVAPHHAEPVSTWSPAEFMHDSLYYSLLEGLNPRPSPYASFLFGIQILDIVKESRGGEYA